MFNITVIWVLYMVTKVQYKQWFHDDNWHCGPAEASHSQTRRSSSDKILTVCQESPSSSSSQGCNSVVRFNHVQALRELKQLRIW